MTHFTILGAAGFIGSALVAALRARGRRVDAIARADLPGLLAAGRPAGHVIDCIGLTADFRTRPLDTADAHVGLVGRCLAGLDLTSFLFLSSTRVYARAEHTREDAAIEVRPSAPGEIYNISKLAGEALCLGDPRPGIRVARLSNVYGPGMHSRSFLGQVLAEGARHGRVTLRQSLRSAKDYIAIADVAAALPAIAERGAARLYNVASGHNVSHDAIAGSLGRLGWQVAVDPEAAALRFPRIDITRLGTEFAAPVSMLLDALPALIPAGSVLAEARC